MKRTVTNADIRAYCAQRRMLFKPWEVQPCDAHGACPYPPHSPAAMSWPKAVALRRRIIADLERQQASKD